MSVLKNKLRLKKDLKQQIEKEDTGRKTDNRFVPYSAMKFGEKMSLLIVPDSNGELWHRYYKHGTNLGVRGLEYPACAYRSSGEECPSCLKAFGLKDLEREAKAAGDEKAENAYKKEAQLWFPKEYCVMSVLVLNSPVEVPDTPDENQVKLMYVPVAVQKLITTTIKEGILDLEELTSTPLILKKEKNQNGSADYSQSYFARKPITDDEVAFFDGMVVEPYNYSDIDLTPEPTTTAEIEEWLELAEEKYEEKKQRDSKNSAGSRTERRSLRRSRDEEDDHDEQQDDSRVEQEEEEERSTTRTSRSRTRTTSRSESTEREEVEEQDDDKGDAKEESEKEPTESVRDRLKRLRNANT